MKVLKYYIIKIAVIFGLGLLALLPLALQAQNVDPNQIAFGNGEKLVYAVSYKVGIVHTDVAEVYMKTSLNGSAYDIEANGKTYPFYNWFFELNDTYYSKLNSTTLKPLELKTEISEAGYRVSSKITYNWASNQVSTTHYNHKKDVRRNKTMQLTANSYDALAMFYNLRCKPTESFVPNKVESFQLVLEDTIKRLQYRFIGKETKSIKGLGKFKTLKFICQLTTGEAESFQDGSEFTLWISDDQNKIPLYVESPIRVGSIRARLLSAENLKFPLNSKQ